MTIDKQETARALMESFRTLHRTMHKAFYGSLAPSHKPTAVLVMMRLIKAKRSGLPGLRVSDIASALGITLPAVTQLATELERDGFARRDMDPSDRRAVLVSITEAGLDAMAPAFAELENGFGGLIDYLGEEESATLVRLLAKTEGYFSETAGGTETRTDSRG